jgi:hypothetical protein
VVAIGAATSPGDVVVFLGTGGGSFQDPVFSNDMWGDSAIALGDFDGDGHPDLIRSGGGGLQMMLGDGTGKFQPTSLIAPDPFVSVTIADFDLDGAQDVLLANENVDLLLGRQGTQFRLRDSLLGTMPPWGGIWSVVSADFDGNGKPDIAWISLGDGTTIHTVLNRTP